MSRLIYKANMSPMANYVSQMNHNHEWKLFLNIQQNKKIYNPILTNKFKVLPVMGRKLSFPPPCWNSNQSYLQRGYHDQPEHQRGG